MSLAQSEIQVMLADMVSRLLADRNAFEDRRRRLSGPAPDRLALWADLAEQGILGAALDEDAGGVPALCAVMEIIGQHLAVEPVLAAFICGRILRAADAPLDPLVSGEQIFAFAHTEGFDPFASPRTLATGEPGAYRLTGLKPAARHADLAHRLIVTATLHGAPAAFLVEAGAPGLHREPFRLIDAASAATVTLENTPAQFLAGAEVVAEALLWSIAGLAAETTGIIAALNAATFAYLNTRKQFGAPLASFQALQHRAADMFTAAEEARILTLRLIAALDANTPAAAALASAAKALTDDAGRKVAHEAVQLHGGMGVSDELNISHYLRRLTAIRAELGGADLHRARFAELTEVPRHAA